MYFNKASRGGFALLCILTVCLLLQGQSLLRLMVWLQQPMSFLQANQSVCACHKCLTEHDTWFMERFNKAPILFLTKQHVMTVRLFKWWKNLQHDPFNITAYNQAVEEMFEVFPDSDLFMDAAPERCRTCAVVGNSGNLRDSHFGALIDSHNVIIRMNRAHTRGFKVDVGSRTTLHLMYPESAVNLDNHTHLLLLPFKTMDIKWLVSAFTSGNIKITYQSGQSKRYATLTKVNGNRSLVKVLNPAFIKYVHEVWLRRKGSYPSTGCLALMVGLHICDEVNVFGYGADKNGNWDHYWEELKVKTLKTGHHGGTNELNLIKSLSTRQRLHFFTGQCCSS